MRVLEDLPNVGPAIAADLRAIGIATPAALFGRNPYAMYDALNEVTGRRQDPCVLDTFIAAVRFVEGGPARPWWTYTAERKRELARRAACLSAATLALPTREVRRTRQLRLDGGPRAPSSRRRDTRARR